MAKPSTPPEFRRQVGLRLKAVRLAMGLDQIPLAKALGVEGTAWGNWERGERLPDALVMAKLELRFGWPMNWIFAGQLKDVRSFDDSSTLEAQARELGAVVGAPMAEFLNEVPVSIDGTPKRAQGRQERRKKSRSTLHEKVDKFS